MERTLTRMRSPCSLELICRATVKQIMQKRGAVHRRWVGQLRHFDERLSYVGLLTKTPATEDSARLRDIDRLVSSHCICESHTDQFTESAMKFIQCFMREIQCEFQFTKVLQRF
ncbi:Hypothetical_protein [Hexamita inflata]|uniref:Hypothetical_protein n=1 Tax=Hexamita inflata TaxID=28002 RepID=A0AA86QW31_9EUKA|nr:Hypothetical protein HINF_LOCUS53345 [Hexamita inflata]